MSHGLKKAGLHLAFISVLALWTQTASAAGHDVCSDCHTGDPQQGLLISEEPLLCYSCHPDRFELSNKEHSIGMSPYPPPPPVLPLKNGVVTCDTCHDPHLDTPGMLRQAPHELCFSCHQDY